MRKVTATEKLRAVNEGSMSKKEFVRQMRQEFPAHITQFNGYADSVQILKNRGVIYEVKEEVVEAHVYDERPILNYSLDALDRAIRIELEAKGITTYGGAIKPEDFYAAEKKAKANLEKNPTHYLDLMSGESNKVDKHDKMKETKRGAADTDTFNALKKATLKEGYTEEQIEAAIQKIRERKAGEHKDGTPKSNAEMGDDEREDFYNDLDSVEEVEKVDVVKEAGKTALIQTMNNAIAAIKGKYGEMPGIAGIIRDFLKTHIDDLAAGADPLDEFENYVDANYDSLSETEETVSELDGTGTVDALTAIIGAGGLAGGAVVLSKLMDALEAGKLGDKGKAVAKHLRDAGKTFSGQGAPMREGEVDELAGTESVDALTALIGAGGLTGGAVALSKLMDSLEAGKLGEKGKSVAKFLRSAGSTFSGQGAPMKENEDTDYSVELLVPSVAYDVESGELADSPHAFATEDEIESGEADVTTYTDGEELDAWVFSNDYDQAMDFAKRYPDLIKINSGNSVAEKKGKDHDGDGDIDGDDYMAAKDKAIKGAMGKKVDEIGMFHDPIGYDSNAAAEDKRALDLIKSLIEKGVDRDTAIEKAGEEFKLRTSYLQKKMNADSQIKEAVKTLIRKALTEEALNEAATGNLSKFSDDYADFAGMTQIINQLENLVTEVEGFYAKTGEKLQKIFDSIGNVTNEEGLKVGGFIAPAIESAFKRDIQPVVKKGFMNSVQIPTIKAISQADIDAHNSGASPLGEEEMEEKQTMFTPVMESKKK